MRSSPFRPPRVDSSGYTEGDVIYYDDQGRRRGVMFKPLHPRAKSKHPASPDTKTGRMVKTMRREIKSGKRTEAELRAMSRGELVHRYSSVAAPVSGSTCERAREEVLKNL
jgi:hypothetical protein